MRQQLDFWPNISNSPGHPQIWEALTPELQAKLIALLARLIRKVICPEHPDKTQENSHEP